MTERSHAKSSISAYDAFEDLEHYRDHLQEIYQSLVSLDGPIHGLLDHEKCATGSGHCEQRVDRYKRAIRTANTNIRHKPRDVIHPITSTVRAAHTQPKIVQVPKLNTIKLEPSSGYIETMSRFWELFESSIDNTRQSQPSTNTLRTETFSGWYSSNRRNVRKYEPTDSLGKV
jgi:hypothetical protein